MYRRPARVMTLLPVLCFLSGAGWIVFQNAPPSGSLFAAVMTSTSIDLTKHEKSIREFEENDRVSPPPKGAIVFTGSSSVRHWHKHLKTDFDGLAVVGRGFGGSTMPELINYMDRLVLPLEPRAVVVYEGDNDLADGRTVDQVVADFREFHRRLRRNLPKCRVYVLAIKLSPSRERMWKRAQEANARLQEWCKSEKGLTFIDIATPMLDESGKPRPELFQKDRLHLNRAGYEIWVDALKPHLKKLDRPRAIAAD